MPIVSLVLLLLSAVVLSTFAARLLPGRLPLPLLQIGVGAALSWAGYAVAFNSHLFLLLFIPPLLFLDGWRIPKGAFFRDWKAILSLAIGLVVFTVVGVGYFVHWLMPAMPLAVAFALAAIVSPTDPVALGAMTSSTPLPSRLLHILEGESLLNDATGLVCFSFAVAAALSGHFSLASASWSFAQVAGGGAAAGIVVTWLITKGNQFVIARTGEEPAIQMLISLLIPFAAYLIAEYLHVSGILAAAVAGIAMHYTEIADQTLAATRMLRGAVWDTLQISLNGIIFILLGEQLPRLLANLPATDGSEKTGHFWQLMAYVLLITLLLAALRCAWVWVSMRLTLLRTPKNTLNKRSAPRARLLAVISIAGVRGAITLAGILTLPVVMLDGSDFPARDLAIFLAVGVIMLSLLIAGIGLPLLAKGLENLPPSPIGASEAVARTAATEAAIRRVETLAASPAASKQARALRNQAALNVLDAYRRHLEYGDSTDNGAAQTALLDAERGLRIEALKAARDEMFAMRRAHTIDDDLHRKLVNEIDLIEGGLSQSR